MLRLPIVYYCPPRPHSQPSQEYAQSNHTYLISSSGCKAAQPEAAGRVFPSRFWGYEIPPKVSGRNMKKRVACFRNSGSRWHFNLFTTLIKSWRTSVTEFGSWPRSDRGFSSEHPSTTYQPYHREKGGESPAWLFEVGEHGNMATNIQCMHKYILTSIICINDNAIYLREQTHIH